MLRRVRERLGMALRGSETVDALMILGSGQTWAQIAQLAFIPVLTRLYSPAQYGEFALFSLVSTAGTVFCTWRYELAIVLAEDDAKGRDVFALASLLAVACSVAYFMLLRGVGGLVGLLGGPVMAWLLCMAMLLQSLYLAMGYWLLRLKAYRHEARGRLVLAGGVGLAQVAAAFAWRAGNGLVAGYVLGYALAVAALAWAIALHCPPVSGGVSVGGMLAQARRYRRFPLISTWEVFAGRAALLLPLALLTSFFGAAVTGLFSLARNVYNMPLSLVSEPASRVFLVKAREVVDDPRALSGMCRAWLWRLGVAGVVVLGMIAWLVPDVFGIMFGDRWVSAGPYMLALLPVTFARFVAVPVMPALIVLEKQVFIFLWQVGLVFIVLLGYGLGGMLLSPVVLVAIVGCLSLAWYVGLVMVVVSMYSCVFIKKWL